MVARKSPKSTVFIAYPFDALYGDMFTSITEQIKGEWDVRFGADLKTSSRLAGRIEAFRNQNKQLFERFVINIRQSDVFIADITTNNPNVLLELGIAINLNKNVLILSGVSLEKLPFDARGFQIKFYRKPEQITKIITDYLETYKEIKSQGFKSSRYLESSYFEQKEGVIESPPETIASSETRGSFRITPPEIDLPRMKDLRLRVEFKIEQKHGENDWFGIMLRSATSTGKFEPVQKGSILVNSRFSGSTDITLYPFQRIVKTEQLFTPHTNGNSKLLEITLVGNRLTVLGNDGGMDFTLSDNINFGHIYISCYRVRASYSNLKIINLDTTTEIIHNLP